MVRRRSGQFTPLGLVAKVAGDVNNLVQGLSRLQRMLYERAPEAWREVHGVFDAFEQGISFLEYEGHVAMTDGPAECLEAYFTYFSSRRHEAGHLH